MTFGNHDPPKKYLQTLGFLLSNVNPISLHGHERIPRGLVNLLVIHKTFYHHLGIPHEMHIPF